MCFWEAIIIFSFAEILFLFVDNFWDFFICLLNEILFVPQDDPVSFLGQIDSVDSEFLAFGDNLLESNLV